MAYHPIMRVDVVTAVHERHARYLPLLWTSLLAQTHGGWRWVLQVDGPPRAVDRVLRDCGALTDPRLALAHHGTREGPAVTRNIALGRCLAPLVQNVDADDELEPHALSTLTTALSAAPDAGYAVGHARDLLPDGQLRDHPLPVAPGTIPRGHLLDTWATTADDYRLPVHPAGVMWRRSLLLALGGWSALQGMEDTGLLMAASATAPGVLVDAPTLRYRRHDGQLSGKGSKFAGGGAQIAVVRRRAALLRELPAWSESPT